MNSRPAGRRKGLTADLARAHLAAIVESSDDAIIAKTLDGIVTSWNAAAEKIFGFTAAEAVGQSITLIIPEERRAEEGEVLARLRRGEKILHFETVRQAKDGRLIDVSLTVSPIRDATGAVIGASKVARDITESRRADLLQARLAAIVESSDDAIIAKTLEGVIVSWNRGAEQIFGFTAAEAVGQPITLIIPDERRFEETDVLTRVRRGEKIDHFETVRRTKDGQFIDISLTVSPIRNPSGVVIGASKVARNITERKVREAERHTWLQSEQRARREAERAMQTIDEFLATVSHELRTPLNAIMGWAHLLQVGAVDADDKVRAIESIVRNAGLQNQLISDLIDMQRLVTGKLHLEVSDVDLTLVIRTALDSIRPAALAKRITLRSAGPATSPILAADSARIQQILGNILSNAVRYAPEDGSIWVRVEEDASHVEIAISDDGPGMSPEFIAHAFERFRQDVSAPRKHGGLGLGLAIVRHLVELHGGTVSAGNRDGGPGSLFTVRLPRRSLHSRASVHSVMAAAHAAEHPARANTPSLRNLRVLVVDDEPDSREVVAALLNQYGADVTVAGSAEEALKLLSRVRPHVLVSDITMPGQDGYALMRAVRALPEAEGGLTPSMALTAAVTTEDRLRALRAGFQLHVTKPVRPEELAEAITSLAGATAPGDQPA